MSAPSPDDELVFLPLGGSGEIGMNLNAYGYGPPDERKWIIVDIGVTFGREEATPGIEIILPDPSYLEDERDNILAIVLTHAHEDHIGALGWLWPRLKAPVYATPFTAALVREKLRETGLLDKVPLTEIPLKGQLTLGPFEIDFVTLTHSIPEPNGLAIRTPLGLIWHTGDWKIDPDPLIGETTDEAKVRAMAEEGVLAMVCDSTNVFVEGTAGSEADVRKKLTEVILGCTGKVAVTAFASNVARVETALHAARAAGRTPCLVGRSMHRIYAAAKSVGLLQDAPEVIDEEDASDLPDEKILFLCTGSQGEPRAALSRIARGEHRNVTLRQGDTVIFSSRVIPGNEAAIHALYEEFVRRGVSLITADDHHIHVSGHPARDELKQMYQWARPRIAIPVHGEMRHIREHVKLAQSLQVPETIAPNNGDMIRLAPGLAALIDEVPAGRLYVDGNVIIETDDEAIRDRKRLAAEGAINIALAVSAKNAVVAGPNVTVRGLTMPDDEDLELALEELEGAAHGAFAKLSHGERDDDDAIEGALVRAVRKSAERLWRKRPLVDVTVLRL
ncbi:MAG TPA: ribonuclease J [Vitreimonas sp.]|uniref:ribonuclease J n=1 Tax=Vitreimonas sp. TaxID=3069702 RepID=UPI002D5AAFC6|nr:ribonuclease J [Vitreimonas sp.]HYD85871.1 ribonuclease J [Vitreimonas sp.]